MLSWSIDLCTVYTSPRTIDQIKLFMQLVSKFIRPLIIFRWNSCQINLINMTVRILGSNMLCFKAWLLNAYKERPCSSFLELGRVLVFVLSGKLSKMTKFGHKIAILWATFLQANYHYWYIIFYDLAKQDTWVILMQSTLRFWCWRSVDTPPRIYIILC